MFDSTRSKRLKTSSDQVPRSTYSENDSHQPRMVTPEAIIRPSTLSARESIHARTVSTKNDSLRKNRKYSRSCSIARVRGKTYYVGRREYTSARPADSILAASGCATSFDETIGGGQGQLKFEFTNFSLLPKPCSPTNDGDPFKAKLTNLKDYTTPLLPRPSTLKTEMRPTGAKVSTKDAKILASGKSLTDQDKIFLSPLSHFVQNAELLKMDVPLSVDVDPTDLQSSDRNLQSSFSIKEVTAPTHKLTTDYTAIAAPTTPILGKRALTPTPQMIASAQLSCSTPVGHVNQIRTPTDVTHSQMAFIMSIPVSEALMNTTLIPDIAPVGCAIGELAAADLRENKSPTPELTSSALTLQHHPSSKISSSDASSSLISTIASVPIRKRSSESQLSLAPPLQPSTSVNAWSDAAFPKTRLPVYITERLKTASAHCSSVGIVNKKNAFGPLHPKYSTADVKPKASSSHPEAQTSAVQPRLLPQVTQDKAKRLHNKRMNQLGVQLSSQTQLVCTKEESSQSVASNSLTQPAINISTASSSHNAAKKIGHIAVQDRLNLTASKSGSGSYAVPKKIDVKRRKHLSGAIMDVGQVKVEAV
eukprot:CAMPEP_0197468246 /NCGR_PEP_ID=MMETSP1175-20131217/65983_1 /TAXON_ID=1003142 /ORGANISM="Triceratium dubium, Strain CCMP147" /LENGTH=590 /DNA_ID=CAMNT_0043004341 /DNA_START=308 /DNA_END=2080 /DNA_ORIENTATION=+